MAHVFISYSTRNSNYAYKVADQLRSAGFDVWIDNAKLRSSDNWWESIVRALKTCAAFVVIMSPEAKESRWVQREVTLADNWQKPSFPVLLAGENWEIFVLTQYFDARLPADQAGEAPQYYGRPLDNTFIETLAAVIPPKQNPGVNITSTGEIDALTVEEDDDFVAVLQNPPNRDDVSTATPRPTPAVTPRVNANRWGRLLGLAAVGLAVLAVIAVFLPQVLRNGGGGITPAVTPSSVTSPSAAEAEVTVTQTRPATQSPMPTLPPTRTLRAVQCGSGVTAIHDIQGTGDTSPLAGETVTIEGIVTADFQGLDRLSGFFVETIPGDEDALASTSEGIFIYTETTSYPVAPSNLVRVSGVVTEYRGRARSSLTELTDITNVGLCGNWTSLTPQPIDLPLDSLDAWEQIEGMYVRFPDRLIISDNSDLASYGRLLLSQSRRMYQPVRDNDPGAAAADARAANQLGTVLIDDGSFIDRPTSFAYLADQSQSSLQSLRAGNSINNLTGVVYDVLDEYRVMPTNTLSISPRNPREAVRPPVEGGVRIASFNVQNYFNGDGRGSGFPTQRGAASLEELDRQRAKLVSAIVEMQADIVSLMELENDGDDQYSAIAELVAAVNDAAGDSFNYALIDSGAPNGRDSITVGLIYNTERIRAIGAPALLDDVEPFTTNTRPPLAQTFADLSSGERFTVIVNHFKSKNCTGAEGADRDQGDGQECYNATRVRAAEALLTWINSGVLGDGDPDFILTGDFNTYASEDPLTTLEGGGFVNLFRVRSETDSEVYTFIFEGEAGYLDHILVSESLLEHQVWITEWHINADEPTFFDYRLVPEYQQAGVDFYHPDPYRSSDHDPVIVDIEFGG